ncbi:Crp/Fnr family transcriptional regulator [Enterococcus sp. DIV0849a]|uniref:Crp/Fnr family transcriptional regulator n=1 Tax=unclassified Enterococcus TaxID=2608891 RepID=UPI001A8CFD7D|nr:Crp/Fnr family transcriptional regulator [Enterococcus sp. DIV0849a]MBO0434656.1 Crp/Fnr family transcriptional regulator [Enterococcus sp. DIV0849a]
MINYLKKEPRNKWTEKLYEKDTLVIDEYEKTENIYYVVEGVLCVEILNHGKRYISSFIFQNDFFGFDSFSTFKQKTHGIRVISEHATVFCLSKEKLLASLNEQPDFYELLLANFADIFQRHYGYFNFLYLPTTERVKSALHYLSDYIGIVTETDHLELPKFITQETLSKFCRTSQSRVSVSLSELEKTGWLLKKKVPITIN